MRTIKNRDKLKKDGLITSLLKSESSYAEHNYMKHFNINTNVDNNNNNNSNNNNKDDDDDTYDIKIRYKISDIRMILSRLRNIVSNKDKKKIKKSFVK